MKLRLNLKIMKNLNNCNIKFNNQRKKMRKNKIKQNLWKINLRIFKKKINNYRIIQTNLK